MDELINPPPPSETTTFSDLRNLIDMKRISSEEIINLDIKYLALKKVFK